jgi:hypothetical protein
MTSKEIEKFIKKNLIGQVGNDLKQKGAYILRYPVKDIVGGFCFERSASDKSSIYIWWFVQPLFIPGSMIYLTFGNRLEKSYRNQSWDNLDSAETTEKIKEIIKKNMPLIESLLEPVSFYNYYRHSFENLRIYEALIYTSIWIKSPNWKQEIQNFIRYIDNNSDTGISWIRQMREEMMVIKVSANPQNVLVSNKENLINLLNL